jgi:hypothetical protein
MNDVFRVRTEAAMSTLKLYISTMAWKIKGSYIKPVMIDCISIYVISDSTFYRLIKQIDNPNPTLPLMYVILKINRISSININFKLFKAESIRFMQPFCDQHAFISS